MSQSNNGSHPGGSGVGRTATATVPRLPGGREPGVVPGLRVSRPRARRRPALIGLGVMLAVVGALAAAVYVSGAGHRVSVLVMVRDVGYGAVITGGDVGTAQVSTDPGVATMPAADMSLVLGQVATTNLATGMLLTPGAISPAAPPATGQVLVAVAVPAQRMPAGSLAAGDHILVVDTPAAGADLPPTAPAAIAATVVRLGIPDVNGTTVVDVTVATADGTTLAALSATGRIAVVLQPAGGSR